MKNILNFGFVEIILNRKALLNIEEIEPDSFLDIHCKFI